LVEGEVTGIDVTTMTGGKADSTMNVDHVAAGGLVTGFRGGTLSGGNVNVNMTMTTVGKNAKVVGAQVTSLDGGSNVKSTQTVDKVEGNLTGVSLDSLGGGVAYALPEVSRTGVEVHTTSIDQHIGEMTGGRVSGVNIENLVIQSSQPEPSSTAKPEIEERIRVDVAAPERVQVDEVFDLAVAIRRPESPILAVDDLFKTVSAPGKTFRSEPGEIIRYRVTVSAPNCVIYGPSEYVFLLQPAQDSESFFFQLAAKKAGRISILIQAYQEGDIIAAQTRVKIEAYVEAVK
jgi:hypothetical protein